MAAGSSFVLDVVGAESKTAEAARAGRAPLFRVDLDEDPYDRWEPVTTAFRGQMRDAEEKLSGMLATAIGPRKAAMLQAVAEKALTATRGLVMYADELRGISDAVGIPIGKLIAMQLVYEASGEFLCACVFVWAV
jgi:beta subunit of N-acylethanolamine-hydrolyzing acid amidase